MNILIALEIAARCLQSTHSEKEINAAHEIQKHAYELEKRKLPATYGDIEQLILNDIRSGCRSIDALLTFHKAMETKIQNERIQKELFPAQLVPGETPTPATNATEITE